MRIGKNVILIGFSKQFRFYKTGFSMTGLYSYRTIIRIGFIQIDIFKD